MFTFELHMFLLYFRLRICYMFEVYTSTHNTFCFYKVISQIINAIKIPVVVFFKIAIDNLSLAHKDCKLNLILDIWA